MITKDITYFSKPGRENTLALAKIVKKRAEELEIKHIVIASNSGETSLIFYEILKDMQLSLISVTEHSGFKGNDDIILTNEKKKELESKGIKVVMCPHALSGVERSITNKFGGVSRVEIIAHTLRLFGSEGIKVAVEIAIMAADTGFIPTDKEIIAVGGTHGGADSAIVLKPAHMNNFFDLEIREIIAKSRQRK